MSEVKTLVLAFIGRPQQPQTHVVTLLKELSLCNMATAASKRVPLLEGVEEVDLVLGVKVLSCNGYAVLVYVMYSAC